MRFVAHGYQSYCIGRMIEEPKLGLFLDMGLGKTPITLTALQDLKYNRLAIGKALVIAPKRVAESTWSREADKWDHLSLLRVSVVLGTARQRIRALCEASDVYVINRDNVSWLVKYYGNAWPFDVVVVDEFSSFKSGQSKRFKALKNMLPHID
ncbi:MAG: SNF2-related protein, partial [Clostridia bacterium]